MNQQQIIQLLQNMSSSGKEMLLRQARFDTWEQFSIAAIGIGVCIGLSKLFKHVTSSKSLDDCDRSFAKAGCILVGLITAIIVLASIDTGINVLYNPLFMELKDLLSKVR